MMTRSPIDSTGMRNSRRRSSKSNEAASLNMTMSLPRARDLSHHRDLVLAGAPESVGVKIIFGQAAKLSPYESPPE